MASVTHGAAKSILEALNLKVSFSNPELLRQALTHRSYGAVHNERLEFVGDSVLNCVIARLLYEKFPGIPEGDLSRVRAALVNAETLSDLSRHLDLGRHLLLGEGELKSGGAKRASILADALEALFGAIFIDQGFEVARDAVTEVYAAELQQLDPAKLGKDPKTRLQEFLQARRLPVPDYKVVEVRGDAHQQTFEIVCSVPALGIETSGVGTNRRSAEQSAAALAYDQVERTS